MKVTDPKTASLMLDSKSPSKEQVSVSAEAVDIQSLAAKTLADDIYHKEKHVPQSDVTYDRPIEITSYKSEIALRAKMIETIDGGEMTQKLHQIRNDVSELTSQVESLQPSLKNKSWGFSVNENNQIVATGDISSDERKIIESQFNSNEKMVRIAKEIPDIFIKGQEYDRGYDGIGDYWGKYDVTRDNFDEIIDLKQLVDSSYFGGVKDGNNFNIFDYGQNLLSQLEKNAEKKYAR